MRYKDPMGWIKDKIRSLFRDCKITLSVFIGLTTGGLVSLSVIAVMYVTIATNVKNTQEAQATEAAIIVDAIESEVLRIAGKIETVAKRLKHAAESRSANLSDESFFLSFFKGAAASLPYLSDLAIMHPDGSIFHIRARKMAGETTYETERSPQKSIPDRFFKDIAKTQTIKWNAPYYENGTTYISAVIPVFGNGALVGVIGISSTVEHFSNLIAELGSRHQATGFILYGDQGILAHPRIPSISDQHLSLERPLHKAGSLGDKVIAHIFQNTDEFRSTEFATSGVEVDTPEGQQLVLTREINTFGPVPWIVGQYASMSDWKTQWRRVSQAALVSLALLVFSVLTAIYVARRVAAPIRKSAEHSHSIRALNLEQIDFLAPSRISELDLQAGAFNRMLVGLRWFETYLPRTLVRQLVKSGDPTLLEPRQAELTVMFTDIQGFTTLSETQDPEHVADLLNQHFEILNSCIEAEGGTIDKYIGDSVLAFWGAPDQQADHAERACRAALSICKELEQARVTYGVKIAVHTGPLIVGNIGAVGRMNYTVIGDTVNTCSRMEALAGKLGNDNNTKILVSDATAKKLNNSFNLKPAGEFSVRGRSGKVETYNLTGKETDCGNTE